MATAPQARPAALLPCSSDIKPRRGAVNEHPGSPLPAAASSEQDSAAPWPRWLSSLAYGRWLVSHISGKIQSTVALKPLLATNPNASTGVDIQASRRGTGYRALRDRRSESKPAGLNARTSRIAFQRWRRLYPLSSEIAKSTQIGMRIGPPSQPVTAL